MIIVPRQARDKDRENSKMTVFLQMYSLMGMNVLGLRRTAVPGQPPPPFVNTLYPLSVKRNATFAMPFFNQMHHFTKTGSGQT
jgi:hypothetical protein